MKDLDVVAFSGISDTTSFFCRKLNFQNPPLNFNASIREVFFGLSTAAEHGFGSFGMLMSAENALLGSLKRDWRSWVFGKKLDLSSEDYKKNFEEIAKQIESVSYLVKLQSGISKTRNQYREPIPQFLRKVYKDFQPLLTELDKPQFNKENFKKEYEKFCEKYKSKDKSFKDNVIEPIKTGINEILKKSETILTELDKPEFNKENFKKEYEKFCEKYKSEDKSFKDNVIEPIKTVINKILEKSEITLDDIRIIKKKLGEHFDVDLRKKLGEHFDVALRVVNGTDMYHDVYKVIKYNEVHLPPLLQFIEGFFIVDDGKYENIEEKLKIYKTIKDVREILFLPQENHTEENFNKLTLEKKESFKNFFEIKHKDLTFAIYQEKIETFFTNQTTYVEGIIRNLDNEKKKLEEEPSYMELLCCWKTKKTQKQINKKTKQIDALRLNLSNSINREELPKLLEKPFSLQLFNPKSQICQSINTTENLIKFLSSINDDNKKFLIYIALETEAITNLDFKGLKELCDLFKSGLKEYYIIEKALDTRCIKFKVNDLKTFLKDISGDKCLIIKKALETEAIKDLDFKGLKELCDLFKSDLKKHYIIEKALDARCIKFKVNDLKNFLEDINDSRYSIIEKALETEAIQDLDAEGLKELCDLCKEGYFKNKIIKKALEKKAITNLDVEVLKELCGLFEAEDTKKFLINKAIETGALKDLDVEVLKEFCSLVGDDDRKSSIINKALETKAIKDLDAEGLKELCGLFKDKTVKLEIIKKALETKSITGYDEKNLTNMIIPSVFTRAINYMIASVACGSVAKR